MSMMNSSGRFDYDPRGSGRQVQPRQGRPMYDPRSQRGTESWHRDTMSLDEETRLKQNGSNLLIREPPLFGYQGGRSSGGQMMGGMGDKAGIGGGMPRPMYDPRSSGGQMMGGMGSLGGAGGAGMGLVAPVGHPRSSSHGANDPRLRANWGQGGGSVPGGQGPGAARGQKGMGGMAPEYFSAGGRQDEMRPERTMSDMQMSASMRRRLAPNSMSRGTSSMRGGMPPALRNYQGNQARMNAQMYNRSPQDFSGPQYMPAYNQTPYEPFNQQLQSLYQNQRALPGSTGQRMTVPNRPPEPEPAPQPAPNQGNGGLPVGPDGRINWQGVNFGGIDWSRVDWGKFLGSNRPY